MPQALGSPCGASPEGIQFHYDVGNDFYALWLDSSMTYSCALWDENDPHHTLDQAQARKIDYHIRGAGASGAARVLDIGCGWGGVLRRLLDTHGVCHAVGLTLSGAQADWVNAHLTPRSAFPSRAGDSAPPLELRRESWLDHAPEEPYDAIISIGAFEHFARHEWARAEKVSAYRSFFRRCHAWLKPGGGLSLQTIAFAKEPGQQARLSPEHTFIAQSVFPESGLPTLGEIVAGCDGFFEVASLTNGRLDYWRTCRAWLSRLLAHRAEALALVGGEVFARYVRYLKLSALAFSQGHCVLLRIAFRRLD